MFFLEKTMFFFLTTTSPFRTAGGPKIHPRVCPLVCRVDGEQAASPPKAQEDLGCFGGTGAVALKIQAPRSSATLRWSKPSWKKWKKNMTCAMVKSRYIGDGHPTF